MREICQHVRNDTNCAMSEKIYVKYETKYKEKEIKENNEKI